MSYTELNKYATMISEQVKLTQKTTSDKVLIMFLNWSVPCGSALGQPVINDGVLVAKLCKQLGYDCFYKCNAMVRTAKLIISKFLSMKHKRVIFYYSGHGTTTPDRNGDEKDGRDENFVFAGGCLSDDEMIELINGNCQCDHLSLIADCCHSGTIFDLDRLKDELKGKVCAISSCDDNQQSTQLLKNGMFTLQLCQLYDEQTGLIDMDKLTERLSKWNQTVITYGDITELFTKKPSSRGIGAMLLSAVSDRMIDEMTTETKNELDDKPMKPLSQPKKLIIKKIEI